MSRVVAILVCLSACQNKAAAPAVAVDPASVLRGQCARFAANPAIPWALAHGVVGLGPEFKASDGRLAIDAMIEESLTIQRSDGAAHYAFPESHDGKPVDPHPNLLVKTLLVAGVPLTRSFHARSGDVVTLKQLEADLEWKFHPEPASEEFWSRAGWTLDAIQTQRSPAGALFVNGAGERIDWNQVIATGFDALERLDAFFETAMAAGQPFVDKRKQGIYQHTCGGFHLIQPLMLWLRFPEALPAFQGRFDRQKKILFYRLQSEHQVYERALQQNPDYRLLVLVQELKFYGHWLETFGRLEEAKAFTPDLEERKQITVARDWLAGTVGRLQQEKAFDSMAEIEKSRFQTYLDLIGDSCHALNGWRLTAP